MKMWLEGNRVKLGPDLSKWSNRYRKGKIVEVHDKKRSPREHQDSRRLVDMLLGTGVLRKAA